MITIDTRPMELGDRIELIAQRSRFGALTIGRSSLGICYLGFGDCADDLRSRFAHATFVVSDARIDLSSIDRLHLVGTDFQISVWRELLNIECGHLSTYSSIAKAIGRDRAVRAVATAIGSNPVSIIVPCHRVVRRDGGLGGYFWGLDIKKRLLAIEGVEGFC